MVETLGTFICLAYISPILTENGYTHGREANQCREWRENHFAKPIRVVESARIESPESPEANKNNP
jgi:hypothetical protein